MRVVLMLILVMSTLAGCSGSRTDTTSLPDLKKIPSSKFVTAENALCGGADHGVFAFVSLSRERDGKLVFTERDRTPHIETRILVQNNSQAVVNVSATSITLTAPNGEKKGPYAGEWLNIQGVDPFGRGYFNGPTVIEADGEDISRFSTQNRDLSSGQTAVIQAKLPMSGSIEPLDACKRIELTLTNKNAANTFAVQMTHLQP